MFCKDRLSAPPQAGPRDLESDAMVRILYVEDNDDNIYMLSARLRRQGYEVIVATNGEQGLIRACADKPALVLMDLSLPALDGWEATRRLKASAATHDIPV